MSDRLILMRGGSVYSPEDPFATAMLIEGSRIAWIGTDGAADAHRDAAHEVIELDGALVTPGFVDSHVHLSMTGQAITGLDLGDCGSLAEALRRIERAARDARGGVLIGQGWDDTRWPEARPPTRQEIDRATYGSLAYLARIDSHSAVVSSALLAACPDIKERDGFEDTGLVRRDAHHRARRAVLESLTDSQIRAFQRAALDRALAHGVVAVHEMGGPDISGERDLRLLVGQQPAARPIVVPYWGALDAWDFCTEIGARGAAGDLSVDGSLGSRTALLAEPYADADHRGSGYLSIEQITEHIVACTQRGLQAGFHVIGDGAMERAAAGFEAAEEVLGAAALRAARHRLEHVEMCSPEQAAHLARWGVGVSMQPGFDAAWGGTSDMYAQRLGEDRARRLNDFAAMASAGVALALSSDSPVIPINPWQAVRDAAWAQEPTHRISVRAAFSAHTRGGWRIAGDDTAGVIASGAPAHLAVWRSGDLVVQAPDTRIAAWSTDPRSGTPGLPDLTPGRELPECLMTFVNGELAHDGR